MLFKKQMNFNSIFDDSYNNYANSIQYDTKYYKQNWPSVYSQEESCQVSNNLNLCSVEKGHDFNRNIENFCNYYCICNTQFQDEQLIEPLNQLVMNNFCCCNDETVGNSNMSIPRSTFLIQNSIPKIYQESENNIRSGNFLGDFKSEANSQQDMNSRIENTSMIKRKDYELINSKYRSLPSQPIGRRLFPGRQVLGSKITKRNMKYFEELQNYNYTLETKVDAESGKQFTIYVCNHPSGCRREFERPWNLLDHIRIHYDVRPHICRICNLRFIQRGNLNKHMLIHLKNSQGDTSNYNQNEEQVNSVVRDTSICRTSN